MYVCVWVCVCLDGQTAIYNAYATDLLMSFSYDGGGTQMHVGRPSIPPFFHVIYLLLADLLETLTLQTVANHNLPLTEVKASFYVQLGIYLKHILSGMFWYSEKAVLHSAYCMLGDLFNK